MKKGLLIVAIALIAVGVCLSFAVLAKNRFRFSELGLAEDSKQVTKVVETVPGTVTVHVETENVVITKSPDEQIHLSYYESKSRTYTVTEDEAGLNLAGVYSPQRWFFFHFGKPKPVEISLPESFGGTLQVRVETGDISVSDISPLTAIDCKSTTGHTNLYRVNATDVTVTASTGEIAATGVNAGNGMRMTSTTGNIALTNVRIGGTLSCEASTGNIDVSDVNVTETVMKTTTGHIHMTNLDAQALTLSASTGNIEGSLAGGESAYRILSSTSTGNNNLPNGTAGSPRTLTTNTTTGNIRITFLG